MVAYVVWLGDNSSQAAGAVEGFFGQDVEVAGAEDEDAAGEVMVGARQAGVQDGREGVGGSPPVPPVGKLVGLWGETDRQEVELALHAGVGIGLVEANDDAGVVFEVGLVADAGDGILF